MTGSRQDIAAAIDELKRQEAASPRVTHSEGTTADHIQNALQATEGLWRHLRSLPDGDERQEAVYKAMEAGFGATDIADGMQISRGRVYQLRDLAPSANPHVERKV